LPGPGCDGGNGEKLLGSMQGCDEMNLRVDDSVLDKMKRPMRDLRISLTDRCNLRCTYCMPREAFGPHHPFFAAGEMLTFDEIERVVRAAVQLGVSKIRLTGGEPLLRPSIERLVERLAGIDGVEDIAMTTNGLALTRRRAESLRDAGLCRVTVSLDALDDEVFGRMNGLGVRVSKVLAAVDTAQAAGFSPIKINAVVKRGANDDQIVPLADYFRNSGHIVRFIEYMDVGHTNGWRLDDVVPAAEIVARIQACWPLVPASPTRPGEVARRYLYADGAGEIGVIASVTQPFCGGCNRVRLSADGVMYTCLFATKGTDLKPSLRNPGTPGERLRQAMTNIWRGRHDRYSEERTNETQSGERIEMSRIGG
jgi:cyclic pyranopterin phosphate synthase